MFHIVSQLNGIPLFLGLDESKRTFMIIALASALSSAANMRWTAMSKG
jgi:hypothetical protein